MKRAAYIPFYASDWLAGTADMTPAEVGVYIGIIARIYDLGGPIRADFGRLSRATNCPPGSLRKLIEGLAQAGKITLQDGLISNARAEKELEIRGQKAVSAQENARSRWSKNAKKTSSDAMRNGCEADAYQNQNQSITTAEAVVSKSAPRPRKPSASQTGLADQAAEEWNAMAKRAGLPCVRGMTEARRRAVTARLGEGGIELWRQALERIERSDFLTGAGNGWRATFDFACTPSGFAKILEGNYDHGHASRAKTNGSAGGRGGSAVASIFDSFGNAGRADGLADFGARSADIELKRAGSGRYG